MNVQNSQKFRVRYASLAELTEVPGSSTDVVPVRRVLLHGRTELTKVSGTGMSVVKNSQKVWVPVWMLYKTRTSSGYG